MGRECVIVERADGGGHSPAAKCCTTKETTLHNTTKTSRLTLTMTRGLPASGKSTWAADQVRRSAPGSLVRVSKDNLRLMLHGNGRGKRTEHQVLEARDAIIERCLQQQVSIIVDDTNFLPYHELRLRELAERHQAAFQIEDFTHVSLEECLIRNDQRTNKVPREAIVGMYETYLSGSAAPGATSSMRREAVIVDIDGTVALHQGRTPFEWNKVHTDTPNLPVIATVRALAGAGYDIVYCSGRDAVCRAATEQWIDTHIGVPGPLFMRSERDNRRDAIVKRELYETHIQPVWDVMLVLDDRDQVVKVWRDELHLPCFQVAAGNF